MGGKRAGSPFGAQESLRTLRALRTLVMSCEHLEAVMPMLDLVPLPSLAHVILDHVYPQRCALPPGCTLDLRCCDLACPEPPMRQ